LIPQEIIDVTLAERFGWTWAELDEQDMAQVLPAVAAANCYASLGRVYAWMEAAGSGQQMTFPSEHDRQVWQAIAEAQKNA
jgi:hypothetical protein